MKKVIFTLLALASAHTIFAQATYYWVGGTGASWTNANSWAATSGGAGGARVTQATTDILIFDAASGSVVAQPGHTTPSTDEEVSELRIINGGNLTLSRTSTGGTTYIHTGTLVVDATSTLNISNNASYNLGLIVKGPAVSIIYGNINFTGGGMSRLSAQGTNILQFASGSTALSAATGTASGFGTTSATNPSSDKSVKFLSGSTFKFRTTINPFPNSSTNIVQFDPGSTFVYEAPILSNMIGSSTRVFGNITISNNMLGGGSVPQDITLNGNPISIDNIHVEAGNGLFIRNSGQTPVTGNITVDAGATFGAQTTSLGSSHLQMIGNGTLQTIGGAGTVATLGTLTVAANANVKIEKNIDLAGTSTGNICGTLDLGSNTISGTGRIQFRSAASVTGTATSTAGSNVITYSSFSTNNVGIGVMVSGANIPPNTYVINTNSTAGEATLSQAATASGSFSVTNSTTSATLNFNNPAGLDGAVFTSGSLSFGTGTNYIFNAATSTPFPVASGNTLGNVTINAPITTNKDADISGILTLNNKLTIADDDSLYITSTGSIAGANATNYVALAKGASSTGVLSKYAFSGATQFPVGSATRYLPVTLTPTAGTADFSVSVFEGATLDGTVGGTALNASQKANVVDAMWNVNRIDGSLATDPAEVTLTWTSDLEGSNFTGFADNQIGISRNNGTVWENGTGNGNNSSNTATATFSSFTSFGIGIGELGVPLPVTFKNITATATNEKVNINWTIGNEYNVAEYVIERSVNAREFAAIGSVKATGATAYNFTDVNPLQSTNYYRIKSVDKDGTTKYSTIVRVNMNGKGGFTIMENPVKGNTVKVNIANVEAGKYSISIVNSLGQTVLSEQFNYTSGSLTKNINIPNVNKGIYNVVLRSAGTVVTERVVVE